MTKANLVEQAAEAAALGRKETERLIDATLAAIADSLTRGEKVDLRGFGSFQVSSRKGRVGRNPKTGEALEIAARRVAIFKPGKELAERVNRDASSDAPSIPTSEDALPDAQPQDGPAKLHGDKIDL